MRKYLFLASLIGSMGAQADIPADHQALALSIARLEAKFVSAGLIDWKVGDKTVMQLKMKIPIPMQLIKEVTKDEGEAIWVAQDTVTPFGGQKTEMLMRKSDGAVLKYLENGEEKPMPETNGGGLDVISQDIENVTVPAGTFKSLKIVAKTDDGSQLTIWMNTREVSLGGQLKLEIIQSKQTVRGELLSFVKNK